MQPPPCVNRDICRSWFEEDGKETLSADQKTVLARLWEIVLEQYSQKIGATRQPILDQREIQKHWRHKCCTAQYQVLWRSKVVPILDHWGRRKKDINGEQVLYEAGNLLPHTCGDNFVTFLVVSPVRLNMVGYSSQRSEQPQNVNFEQMIRGLKSDIFDLEQSLKVNII